MAMCNHPGTKHDLNCIYQRSDEPLRSYIRRFSEVRNSIPNITEAEVIYAFTRGVSHRELRSKLNRKPPKGIDEMLTIVNQYADAEEAEWRHHEETGARQPPRPRLQTSTQTTAASTVAPTTTAHMIEIAALTLLAIEERGPNRPNFADADQTTTSPRSVNPTPSGATTSSTRRSWMDPVLSTKMPSTR
jgi:hypothetical protein